QILQPSDVGQDYPVYLTQGYTVETAALSAFLMELSPAGEYDSLDQIVNWWPTATEATYGQTYESGLFLSSGGFVFGASRRAGSGSGEAVTPVDLSAVGDGATGYIVTGFGLPTEVDITLTNGQAGTKITAVASSTVQASDVQSLAQAAANRLDAGLGP